MSGTENNPTGTLDERLRLGAGFAEADRPRIVLLESVNLGVSQQVARFEDMHAAQRDKELDGEKWTAEDEYRYQEELRWKLSDEGVDTEE